MTRGLDHFPVERDGIPEEAPGRVPPRLPPCPEGWDGFAAPGSIVWKVNGEAAILLGWGRAILLQIAHPLVAAGVAEHSTFRAGPWGRLGRLRRTLETMLALTFGTAAEGAQAARRIDTIHGRVRGILREDVGPFPAGTPYWARDPELLRWVHATLLDSFLRTYELFVGPLTPEEQDRFCLESSAIGPPLGIPEGFLPTSRAALHHYLREMIQSGRIVVGPTARDLARDILAPPLPLIGSPLRELLLLPIVGLLPEPIRSAYGLPWDERRETALVVAASISRLVLPRLPPLLRRWPAARRAERRARLRSG
ncbi:MAG: DUF2236 domain-containing protein [Chloroflexi bacterium]|nr:DUF2236 domain-containing protein [Chloroflexota bacterium]